MHPFGEKTENIPLGQLEECSEDLKKGVVDWELFLQDETWQDRKRWWELVNTETQ